MADPQWRWHALRLPSLLLFADGLPVPEATVRAAFRAAVDTVARPGENDGSGEGVELHGAWTSPLTAGCSGSRLR